MCFLTILRHFINYSVKQISVIGQQLAMLRLVLNDTLFLQIAIGIDLLYDLFKPHTYLGQDFRNTYGT